MAIVTKDLITQWGKEAAHSLINDDVPLNTSITKIASDNSLNTDQIARVVEAANISTHLSVAKSDNNYPEFDVADTRKIASLIAEGPTDSINIVFSDYDAPPKEASVMEKQATCSGHVKKKRRIDPKSIKQASIHYENKLAEMELSVYEKAEDLRKYVKQACLDPDSPKGPLTLMKAAALACTNDYWRPATEAVMNKIESTMPELLVKKASVEPDLDPEALLNTKSEFITKLSNYLDAVKRYAIAKDSEPYVLNKYASKTPTAAEMAAETYKGTPPGKLGRTWTKKLFKGTAIAAIPVLAVGGIYAMGSKSGQETALQQMGPMNKKNIRRY